MGIVWKKGRGKLGAFAPLLGRWRTEADTELGPLVCERTFETLLGGKYVQLRAVWRFDSRDPYEDLTLFGPHADASLGFWSFTSDGKRSERWLSEATEIHEKALCFEADMPAGRARQIYFPDADGGVRWLAQSRTKKGWNELAAHRLTAA